MEDVKPGLEKYLEQEEEAEKLEREIQKIDSQIDAIVFDLYNLNKEEARNVLDSLKIQETEKADILRKYKKIKN